jgi:hypothetical protein
MSEIRVWVDELVGGTYKDPWTLFLLVQNDKPIRRVSACEFCHIFDNERGEWYPTWPEAPTRISKEPRR